jgi:excisionase family DNA binding protein
MVMHGTCLTVGEIARELRYHRNTVYGAVQRGELPAVRIGEHGALRVRAIFGSCSSASMEAGTRVAAMYAGRARAFPAAISPLVAARGATVPRQRGAARTEIR